MSVESIGIGNPYLPMIGHRQFEKAVRHIGTKKLVHRKVEDIVCPTCFDTLTKQSDPNCTVCNGLGRTQLQVKVEGIVRHRPPHGMYGAGHVLTIAGENERADMMLYAHRRYKDRIIMGDFIIYDGYEYRVMSSVARRGSRNRIVYMFYELFKTVREVTS